MTDEPEVRYCACCHEPVRLMTETIYCGRLCRQGKCDHIPWRRLTPYGWGADMRTGGMPE